MRSLAEQANDARRAGRFGDAERLFREAHEALPARVHGLERARLLVVEASLDRDQLRYAAALRRLEEAEHLFRLQRAGGCLAVDFARVHVKRAIVYDDMGEHHEAQEQCSRVFGLVSRAHPLAATALYVYIESELVIGDRRNARRWFEALRPAARRMELDGDPLDHRLRVDWIEALIRLSEGQPSEARRIMARVAQRYLAGPNRLHAARALIDLTDCSLQAGCDREAAEAGELLADVCGALRWREAETAFRLLLARLAARRCPERVLQTVLAARSRCLARGGR